MGRMCFNIIPRDGKAGTPFGEAALYDSSDIGRYEMYIDDYADDVCEGETQTARRAYCENAAPLLDLWVRKYKRRCGKNITLGDISTSLRKHIADMDEFLEICSKVGVTYEVLPLLIERFDL